uniref:Two pore calcium channel protein 1 n=1 Tax=Magallana gigas TaxID=29159 RepID=K1QYW6_MAGGI
MEEFYDVYSVLDLQWQPKQEEFKIWSSNFRYPFNFIFKNLVIAVNFAWILEETISLSRENIDVTHYNFTITWASIIFICIYTLEASIKILGKGPVEYFTTGWDLIKAKGDNSSEKGKVTLFELTVVVMTIVVAFILELFLFRIQYRRKLKLDDIDDHAKQTAHVYLSDEEKIMCENDDYKWTGGLIALQKDSTDLQTPYLYRGERYRNKMDFSLRMYGDEVKIITRMSLYEQSWLEEEQDSRDQTIHTMTELRRRSRPNADLEDLDEDFIPSPTLPTPREEFVQESSPAYYNPGAENLQGESEDQEAKRE